MKVKLSVLIALLMAVTANACGVSTGSDGGAPDTGAPDAGFQCPKGARFGSNPGIVPRPAEIYDLAESRIEPGATISIAGADTLLRSEVEAIADSKGLEVVEAGGSIAVTVNQYTGWTAKAAACSVTSQSSDAYIITSTRTTSGVSVIIDAPSQRGAFYALKTIDQMISGEKMSIMTGTMIDWPETEIRAVLEGFYGAPWSNDARLDLMRSISNLKYNIYIFAPKNDLWITALWREPYPKDELLAIRKLVAEAKKNLVRVCWEMHPDGKLIFSGDTDLKILLSKYTAVAAQGVDCFILAFDDNEKRLYDQDLEIYTSYVQGQVDFTNRVGEALGSKYPDAMLGFVPNDYWTNSKDTPTDLAYIGKNLDWSWAVAWTGTEVISKTITVPDAEYIAGVIGRKPFLGDNYPVSDTQSGGVMVAGPLTGRGAGVPEMCWGVAFNGMPYPYSSTIGFAFGADWAWNPAAYEPAGSAASVARFFAGESGKDAMLTFINADFDPAIDGSASPALDAAIAAFWSAWDGGTDIEGPSKALAIGFFTPYTGVPAGLAGSKIDPDLLFEIAPWGEKLAVYGEAGLGALDLLKIVKSGGKPAKEDVDRLQASASKAASLKPKPTGKAMDDFLHRTIEVLEIR